MSEELFEYFAVKNELTVVNIRSIYDGGFKILKKKRERKKVKPSSYQSRDEESLSK